MPLSIDHMPIHEVMKKLTATDMFIMSAAARVDLGSLFHCFCHECARVSAQGLADGHVSRNGNSPLAL